MEAPRASGEEQEAPFGTQLEKSHSEEVSPCQGERGLECPAQLIVNLVERTGPVGH